jgi:cell division protein DivIC
MSGVNAGVSSKIKFVPMNKLLKFISIQKYRVTIGVFAVWMLIFDGNSALFIYKQYNELKDLRLQETFLQKEIADMKKQKLELFSTNDKLEKYARENYYFKKDNEDVYVVEE